MNYVRPQQPRFWAATTTPRKRWLTTTSEGCWVSTPPVGSRYIRTTGRCSRKISSTVPTIADCDSLCLRIQICRILPLWVEAGAEIVGERAKTRVWSAIHRCSRHTRMRAQVLQFISCFSWAVFFFCRFVSYWCPDWSAAKQLCCGHFRLRPIFCQKKFDSSIKLLLLMLEIMDD